MAYYIGCSLFNGTIKISCWCSIDTFYLQSLCTVVCKLIFVCRYNDGMSTSATKGHPQQEKTPFDLVN
jgi:hypothetical protein